MDDRTNDEAPRGIFESLRALLETLVAVLHNRSQLVTTEIEEELSRLVRVLLWAIVAVFSVIVALTFLGAMLLLAAPPQYRALAAAGLGLLFLLIAGAGGLSIRRILRSKPRPFDASLGELEKDLQRLRGGR